MLKWYGMQSWRRKRNMKTIEEYMRLPYRLEIVPDPYEGGFAARYP